MSFALAIRQLQAVGRRGQCGTEAESPCGLQWGHAPSGGRVTIYSRRSLLLLEIASAVEPGLRNVGPVAC